MGRIHNGADDTEEDRERQLEEAYWNATFPGDEEPGQDLTRRLMKDSHHGGRWRLDRSTGTMTWVPDPDAKEAEDAEQPQGEDAQGEASAREEG